MNQKVELMEKNHKHEIGVEIAHHRDVKKRLQFLNDENSELKARLEVCIQLFLPFQQHLMIVAAT